jgi:hypothetical protein
LADALNAARVDPATADALFTDQPVEDTNGHPIEGFESARWEKLTSNPRKAVWGVRDSGGHVVARLQLGAPRPPRWRVDLFEM